LGSRRALGLVVMLARGWRSGGLSAWLPLGDGRAAKVDLFTPPI